MQTSVRIEVSEEFFREVDQQLARMEIIARSKLLEAGVRKGLNLVKTRVRQILPKPGYPGDKPELRPLRDTVGTTVKVYRDRYLTGVVGYRWDGGQHGHIVEHGHRIASGGTLVNSKRKTPPKSKVTGLRGTGRVTGFVRGRYYLKRAVESLGSQIEATMVESIREAVAKAENG